MAVPKNIDERLSMLAGLDADAADRIRAAAAARRPRETRGRPDAAARAAVQQWLREKDPAPGIIIAPGIGPNCEVAALLELAPRHSMILLVERDASRALDLFNACPVEEYVDEGRLRLALAEDEARIEQQFLALVDIRQSPSFLIFDAAPLPAEDSGFYSSALLALRNRMRMKIFNLGTLMKFGPLWQANALKNLPALVRNPGINALAGLFPGKPAIVVAAGPSLNDALPLLRENAPGFVLISVGQALRPLRNAGIRPDLVVSVDAKEMTQQQFATECNDLYMACSSIVYPTLPARFEGIFSGHINSNPVGAWISSFGQGKGTLYPGGTVSATAMDLAVQMGCDPILTVGLDLSMGDDGSSHARDTQYDGERFDTDQLIPTKGNYEDTVYTKSDFRVYIDLISNYVRFYNKIRFINVNNGGARIEGMDLIPHKHIPDLAAGDLAAYAGIKERHKSFAPHNIQDVCADARRIAEQMQELEKDAVAAAMLCNRLIMLVRMPQAGVRETASDCLAELEAIDKKIADARESSLILDMSLRQAYYAVGKQAERHEERLASAVLANRESRGLYEQMAGAAKWTRELLLDAAEQIEREERFAQNTDRPVAHGLHAAEPDAVGKTVEPKGRQTRLTA